MGETISLLVGGLVVENFDGHWMRISIPAERIQTATDDDTKKLVTALWDAISDEIASDKASAHEIYDASLSDDERESKEMEA